MRGDISPVDCNWVLKVVVDLEEWGREGVGRRRGRRGREEGEWKEGG